MKTFNYLSLWTTLLFFHFSFSQEIKKDSVLPKNPISDVQLPVKVTHAEPLYIDLIRDLGARKGEKEWNIAMGIHDYDGYYKFSPLIEYEWAPMDRLGLEVELPFSFYQSTSDLGVTPSSKLDEIKLAAQYTFWVSEKHSTSMALGYIQEFKLNTFSQYKNGKLFTGNVYNPFIVAAKRWGRDFHTMLYTGPVFEHTFGTDFTKTTWQINSNFHYMIPNSRHFVGLELNKKIYNGDFTMVFRPQMRVALSHNLVIGGAVGIPLENKRERMSGFLRIIYEP
ncbi:MAG: phosphoribosylformylglycinamidine synthase [Cloacibacterium sp.]|jgi:hypothetical protein|nr:phosphoribosylformylglycinamidine synthase [Cloacibacterium sp.]